jgi:hypothetical protein
VDLLLHILRYWRSILFLIFILGMVGWLGTSLLQPEWEAVAVIKPGFVLGEQVEAASEVVDRVRGPEFLYLVMAQTGAKDKSVVARHLRDMKVVVIGDDAVRISVRDYSPEGARLLAEKVIQQLQRRHAEIIQARVAEFRDAIGRYRKQIDAQTMPPVSPGALSGHTGDRSAIQMASSYNMLSELEAKTLPPKTVATTISQQASAWPTPVWPNKLLFCVLFCTIGAMFGFARALASFKA